MIVANPPDVCQVVEVTTESDEPPLSMSHLYPLQISPVSSYAGKHPGGSLRFLLWKCWEDAGGQGEGGSTRVAGKDPEMSVRPPSAFLMKLCTFHLGKQLGRSEVGNISCRF